VIRVQQAPFDAGAELNAFLKGGHDAGAVASFVGVARSDGETGAVARMTLEHYPGMTERELERIEAEARARWTLTDVLIVHRHGDFAPGDPIVLVIAGARHRGPAFEAAAFLMDYLKTRAPFWKKEEGPEGARWVDARDTDTDAARRWK